MYDNKHKCARGYCDKMADEGQVVCESCKEYLIKSKTYDS